MKLLLLTMSLMILCTPDVYAHANKIKENKATNYKNAVIKPAHQIIIGWTWIDDHYEKDIFVPGHWSHPHLGISTRTKAEGPPPQKAQIKWVPGYWVSNHGGKIWISGYWIKI